MVQAAVKPERILVVDDDPGVSLIVRSLLANQTVDIRTTDSVRAALDLTANTRFDLVILDHLLPDGEGLECLPQFLRHDRSLPVLYITAATNSQTAIEAIKLGAFDYLSKPLDFDRLKSRMLEALQSRRLTRTPVILPGQSATAEQQNILVGNSAAMQEVYKAIGRYASLDVPVLISGEVGTGRELIARSIYQHSLRSERPFARISCSDFLGDELAQELFGNTGPTGTGSPGWLEQFHGSTLLIEDLQSMPSSLQSRLLRVLRDKQISKREDLSPVPTDVRVMLAVTGDVDAMVRDGRIRSDLFYYLNAYTIRVPPLRDRNSDLEQLVNHFTNHIVKVSSAVDGGTHPRISPEVMRMLRTYRWPGNVAELQSVLQRVLVEANGAIVVTDSLRHALGTNENISSKLNTNENELETTTDELDGSTCSESAFDVAELVRQKIDQGSQNIHEELISVFETKIIEEVLKHTTGNQAHAARLLGITRTSLRRKIASGGIELHQFALPTNPHSTNAFGAN